VAVSHGRGYRLDADPADLAQPDLAVVRIRHHRNQRDARQRHPERRLGRSRRGLPRANTITYQFPSFVPTARGTITWTLDLVDDSDDGSEVSRSARPV